MATPTMKPSSTVMSELIGSTVLAATYQMEVDCRTRAELRALSPVTSLDLHARPRRGRGPQVPRGASTKVMRLRVPGTIVQRIAKLECHRRRPR